MPGVKVIRMATTTPDVAHAPMRPAWLRDVADVAAELDTDLRDGLTSAEASSRFGHFGANELEPSAPVPRWRKFAVQFADPLIYLLLAAIVISLVAWLIDGRIGVPFDVVVIVVIVVINAMLGYLQQARADQAVAALRKLSITTATVVRAGREQRVASSTIVRGDIVMLAEGDAIAADARLEEAASLSVAEASLTGESEAVEKHVATLDEAASLGDRLNMVFSGTSVVRGRGRAVVTATGMDTEMGNVARLLGTARQPRTPLQREVDRIGKLLGIAVAVIAVVVIGTILLTADHIAAGNLIEVLLIGVSLAVAAVPEGLPAILSVVLGLGVQRLAVHKAIVKKLSSVETLGAASVICSDKTGTLTKGEMTVERVVTASGEATLTGTGYDPVGDLLVGGVRVDDPALLDEVRLLLVGGSLANDAGLHRIGTVWSIQGDPTDGAFLVAEAKLGFTAARIDRFSRIGELPFTSERKLMTTVQRDTESGAVVVVTKGAPDVLLSRCSHERSAGVVRALTDARRTELLTTVDRLADDALRTLAVGYRVVAEPQGMAIETSIEHELVYLGMVGIIDPPRPEVMIAIEQARAAGIRIVMITGDHPRTAARIATELGIVSTGNEVSTRGTVMTGVEIEALADAGLREAIRTVSVYARVAPAHKLRIVKALQFDRNIVAMTGDGVNDAPALKAADIGVAMGMTGTDVSKEAADMILADDNFATIIDAVREGRAIFANIRTFLRFLLSSNIGEVFTMFFGVVFAGVLGLDVAGESVAVPLLATQILWINLLTDTAPALAMGFDPPPADVMLRPPRGPDDRVIDRRMWIGIVWIGLVMAVVTLAALDLGMRGGILGGTGGIEEGRTMAMTTLVFAQMFNTINARSDRASAFRRLFTNRLLWMAIGLSIVLQVAVVQIPFMNRAFGTVDLRARDWLFCIGLASVVLWAAEVKKLIQRS